MHPIDHLAAALRRREFRRDRAGNVTLTFALALIPIVGAVGAAVDYSRANNFRSQLMAAADAAAVGAVAKTSPAVTAAGSMSQDGNIPAGQTHALNIFDSQLAGKSGFWTNLNRTATVTRTNGMVNSQVQFTANVPTAFMGLFGKSTIPISGTSKASNSLPTYIDFHLLLDNTPSMGLGATN